jgi:phytoene dehydrogenase-like protein
MLSDDLVALAGSVAAGCLSFAVSTGLSAALGAVVVLLICWSLFALVFEVRTFVAIDLGARRRGLGHDRWHPSATTADVDVIVIGSGMAGLSCASTLASLGWRVLVLERHEVIGGGAHTYAVDGKSRWKFDSGLHYTNPQAAYLLALAAGTPSSPVDVLRMGEPMAEGSVYDRILLSGSGDAELRIVDDKQMFAELKRRFPAHTHALDRFVSICAGLLWRFPLWCASALLPWRVQRVFLASALFAHWQSWASRTADDALAELFPGEDFETRRLRAYLSGLWIDAGCPPSRMSFFMLAATTVGFPHEGGAYPTGGSDAMALALAAAIEARGGRVIVRAEVASVIVEGERVCGVQMADGSRVAATTVISAAGYRTTTGARPASRAARAAAQKRESGRCVFGEAKVCGGRKRRSRWTRAEHKARASGQGAERSDPRRIAARVPVTLAVQTTLVERVSLG